MAILGYENVFFNIMQDASNLKTLSRIKEMETSYLSTQRLLLQKEELLLEKEIEIIDLKDQINNNKEFRFKEVSAEIKSLFEGVDELYYSNTFRTNFTAEVDTIPNFQVKWNKSIRKKNKVKETEKLQNWLRIKTKNPKVVVKSS